MIRRGGEQEHYLIFTLNSFVFDLPRGEGGGNIETVLTVEITQTVRLRWSLLQPGGRGTPFIWTQSLQTCQGTFHSFVESHMDCEHVVSTPIHFQLGPGFCFPLSSVKFGAKFVDISRIYC